MDAKGILKKYYGYDSFRPGQQEIVDRIVAGQDAVGIMPTGGGKSLCYQIPALLLEGVTIVISPLISLMKDQVDTLKEYGIAAELINSTLSVREFREIMEAARSGVYKMLYVAPERLETDSFLELVREVPIAMVAVDEAHCVSQWGHDFRPSYRRIKQMIGTITPRPRVAAFTATATPLVKEDIIKLLGLQNAFELVSNFDRPNLYFEVKKPINKLQEIVDYIQQHPGDSGIIYCATRKNVEEVCEKLNRLGVPATRYHGGLGEGERSQNQEAFLFDRTPIMIATNAFGMGIDKPNVRFVLHFNMPRNMESYYQEAGRAGRDGEAAECILLFSTQDIMTNRFLIENGGYGVDHSHEYEKLNQMVDYCNIEGCLRSYILDYFGQEPLEEGCKNCGSCKNETAESVITVEAQKIMSCVKRMREQFGSTQVVDVLRGAKTQRIISLGFHKLPTYGIMKEYSKDTLKELISFLIAGGYLQLVGDQYPILRLTEASYEVLKGQKEVTIKRVIIQEAERVVRNQEKEGPMDAELFEQLRQLRYEIATTQHVQPFMVFPDTTLKDMSRKYPVDETRMLQVSGVGEHKLEKYGHQFIEVIKAYVEENNITLPTLEEGELRKKVATPRTSVGTKSTSRDSHILTHTLYLEGKTIDEIVEERNLTQMTIENHLLKCIEEGLAVDFEQFIPAEYEEQIVEAINQCGRELLKPIKEALPEEISYTAIKFTLAKYKDKSSCI